ncbi:MAG: T9SS type A sorting domain-containing protein [Croceimicrobium sp.]
MKIKLSVLLLFTSFLSFSQTLSVPKAEGVYGGQVGDFEVWSFSSDSIYIVTSTLSPNSLFWVKAKRNGSRENLNWQTIPSADADDGFGSSISNIEIHEASNTVFFLSNGDLYSTSLSATTANLVESLVKDFIIVGDTMAIVRNNPLPSGQDILDFGPLSSSGVYTKSATINLLKNYSEPPQMLLNPSNNHLHLFDRGASPHMYMVMDPFYNMSASTSLSSAVSPSPTTPNIEWRTFGFDNAGNWYLAGQPPLANPTIRDRRLAWSTDNGFTWSEGDINTPGPIGGVVGNNMLIKDNGSTESLYIGNAIEKDISSIGNWLNPGIIHIDNLNRANDGYTKADPLDGNIVYHSTNIGFGFSTEIGDSIFGWNEGLEAIQVNDIDMTADFSIGWVASKSGLRKVSDYKTSSPTWSSPIFPQFDGAPYTAIGICPENPDTVFAGNQRIYRSQNGGQAISASNDGWTQVFSPENAPLNFNRINTHCTSIAVSPDSAELVMVGYSIDHNQHGGCFYSLDGGNNWQQLLILATSPGHDVDVRDIVFTMESGKIVAYIGLASDNTTTGHYGLFRAELGSTGFSLSRELSSFSSSVDGVVDLELNDSRDSLFVLVENQGLSPNNKCHVKDLNSGTWQHIAGISALGEPTAITYGNSYIFIAMDEEIYLNTADGSLGWTLAYSYPIGTQINVLFYDELLVGTGTGLYAHDLINNVSLEENSTKMALQLYPNPADEQVNWSGEMKVQVFNLLGQKVYESTKAESAFPTGHLQNGLYLIKFENGQQSKMLIQH